MKRILVGLGFFLALSVNEARADDAPVCSVTGTNILSPDQGGDVSIGCSGVTEATGRQFADILTRILQNRLDPSVVMTKLDEVDRLPDDGVARTIDDTQKQLIIQNLVGKPTQQISITAHVQVDDSADLARAIATPLMMVGWQIDGNQIRRAAPKALDPVQGLAIIVRDTGKPPQKAVMLKTALAAAHMTVPLVPDPGMQPDGALLWIGRRPGAPPPDPQK